MSHLRLCSRVQSKSQDNICFVIASDCTLFLYQTVHCIPGIRGKFIYLNVSEIYGEIKLKMKSKNIYQKPFRSNRDGSWIRYLEFPKHQSEFVFTFSHKEIWGQNNLFLIVYVLRRSRMKKMVLLKIKINLIDMY